MDKKLIKTFAIEARVKLRESVMSKLAKLGITDEQISEITEIGNDTIEIKDNHERFTGNDVKNRAKLVEELNKREQQTGNRQIAYDTLVEEVAYTWFNRLIAIRFMEVNDYLPERERVLSSESGIKQPDIITHLLDTEMYAEFDLATKERVTELLSDSSADAVDELYQLVFIKQCNSLNQQLPDLFEKINDYTELLFTVSYIDDNGVIASLLNIPEDAFNVDEGGQVEIIGWMYQYYNTEPKDKVFARGSRKIRADEIPAATQLFTPDWIVRYMVENSLGRYYIDQKMANPNETRTEKEIADEFGWQYYLPTAEQPEDVQLQIQDERKAKGDFALQELKLLDNAMGSGHVLAYAFDVFMQLYTAEGFRERDAAELIITNNLFGLEIDKRAYQLAYFAIMMKGREYNRRILSKEIKLNLHQFIDSPEIPNEYFERLAETSPYSHEVTTTLLNQLTRLLDQYKNATEIGSILKIEELRQSELDQLEQFIGSFKIFSDMDVLYQLPEIQTKVSSILNITRVLLTKYTAVTTNPPYLNKMSSNLDKYVKKNYPDVKTDLFSVFIKMNSSILTNGGYAGFMTPFVWMFIKSYEELRSFLITNKSISSLIQMEYSAFEEATVPVCCFMIKNAKTEPVGNYLKLSDFKGGMTVQKEKVLEAIQKSRIRYFYQMNQNNFMKIPGLPISFWVSENMINLFQEQKSISDFYDLKVGIQTGDNPLFYKKHWEINPTCDYWVKCNKNGEYRRWYGNLDTVIFWKNNGEKIKKHKSSRPQNSDYYFREGVAWSNISSSANISARFENKGMIFDQTVPTIFPIDDATLIEIIAYMNSKIAITVAIAISPTMHFNTGEVAKYPYIPYKDGTVNKFVKENIKISKDDWDSLETSWDFKQHPLL
ncbi:BREX-1 system adenine-specific DNA-methyltransferase PglX [Latilactobacillus sakei]|uniref:BREX-1 system adenine-specific DNA-methyltransferase PglX n=1 Tax=Latilactobacillus sakei TaxID=1599 RepID=UPI0020921ED7|nr:BREX-1 system adenine-specific DNA-methyltransferase PglX [Latilactobacillus sakei]USS38082.1 BREX-1 system adenine-specific DNA-methyltransferase PglX [Latilactobacillus sakei]